MVFRLACASSRLGTVTVRMPFLKVAFALPPSTLAGKATTPFLLQRVNALTGGQSLAANIALVRHNARTAAQIAVAFSALAPGR